MRCRLFRALLVLAIFAAGVTADVVDVQPFQDYATVLNSEGWQPRQKAYAVTNTSSDWVYWQAVCVGGLTVCQPRSGWLAPSGSVNITIVPAPYMNAAPAGVYSEQVSMNFDSRLAGDINGDGQVDVIDLMRFIEAFGRQDSTCDFDRSGMVDVIDLMPLLSNIGRRYSSLQI